MGKRLKMESISICDNCLVEEDKHVKTITFIRTVLILCSLFSFLSQPLCSPVWAEQSKKLTSLEKSFYTSISKGDGIVQLSDCKELTKTAMASFIKPFACIREINGFRCTTDKSLDVIFVFENIKDCNTDRNKTLNSDED